MGELENEIQKLKAASTPFADLGTYLAIGGIGAESSNDGNPSYVLGPWRHPAAVTSKPSTIVDVCDVWTRWKPQRWESDNSSPKKARSQKWVLAGTGEIDASPRKAGCQQRDFYGPFLQSVVPRQAVWLDASDENNESTKNECFHPEAKSDSTSTVCQFKSGWRSFPPVVWQCLHTKFAHSSVPINS